MAEIKSTLEMVLARAEAMCAEAPDLPDKTQINDGMKFGAAFINDDSIDIVEKFSSLSAADKPKFAEGMLKTFFRFIVLPRDDSKAWHAALQGINAIAAALFPSVPEDFTNMLNEVSSLLGRYPDHRNQLQSQLKEQFAMQAAQLSQTMAQQTGMKMDIPPERHPKFNEEWGKVVSQLDGQYTNALGQYKAAIAQLFNFSY